MKALTALHQRVSIGRVCEPGPSDGQCEAIFRAALRAADHGNLRPWRFLVIRGAGREQLGELFSQALQAAKPGASDAALKAAAAKALRAPLIVVCIAVCQEHPKVPAVEQQLSAGAAVQNMLNAAFALGVGAYWRTGEMAYHPVVRRGLGLAEQEHIVGYLYLGTPAQEKSLPQLEVEDFFSLWPAKP